MCSSTPNDANAPAKDALALSTPSLPLSSFASIADNPSPSVSPSGSPSGSSSGSTGGDLLELPLYRLREHCQHLRLRTETTETHTYWYCDWTNHFVQHGAELVKDVVQDYCQPFASLAELQERLVGISCLSEQTEDPLPVRTVSIRLRPDCKQHSVLQAVHEAFTSLHFQHYHVVKSTMETFHAIGADGAVPFFITAQVATHKTTLERRLWIRFYHYHPDADHYYSTLTEDDLQRIGAGRTNPKKAPLRNVHTPINTQLAEACVLVQYVLEHQLEPSFPCPARTQKDATTFFQTTYTPSVSVLQHNQTSTKQGLPSSCASTRTRTRTGSATTTKLLFPSLANDDYSVLQESYPLLDRIWSELEMEKCTYNTLVEESARFGMRPCQPTLDKDFCFQLSQISQQRMLMELSHELRTAETILHDTLNDYHELELLLMHAMRRTYNIPIADPHSSSSSSSSSSLDIGQTPISLTKRKFEAFPWHPDVRQALQSVSNKIALGCLKAFDPNTSLTMADDSVHHVFTSFGTADDGDQTAFLKTRNRQAMIRVSQQQAALKRLLETIILAPTIWHGAGSLPKLTAAVDRWYEISQHAKTSNLRRSPVPIFEFHTKLGGQGCLTCHQLILSSPGLGSMGSGLGSGMSWLLSKTTQVQVFDWVDIDVKTTPKNPLTKVVVMVNGKRVAGFNPIHMDPDKLIQIIHVLKALQEA